MARKNSNPKPTDPADLTLRVWVIEQRYRNSDKWLPYDIIRDHIYEYTVAWNCKTLAERDTTCEFRYRAATLTFDDDGRKCVIY